MAASTWEFWKLTRAVDGALSWLAATRPDSRAVIDRKKVWTLVPQQLAFIANWYVSEDHWQVAGHNVWVHEWIDVADARLLALEVPTLAADQLARLTRPEAVLTLDQIDRHPTEKLLGTRVARALMDEHRT